MRIVVVGAGKVGTFIATDLSRNGHEVVMVEREHQRIDRRRAQPALAGVTWVHADGCEVTELEAAEPGRADVLAAVTGDDEDNLVISLLAKQEFAVPRVLARVNHPSNEWLFDELWGVDVAVSTPHLLSALVEEAVETGALVRLFQFAGNRAQLIEVTLLDDSPCSGWRSPRRVPEDRAWWASCARVMSSPPGRHRLPRGRRGARPGRPRHRGRGTRAAGRDVARLSGRPPRRYGTSV
ncbi:MAG: TrkA family potassium uptake protein [Acidimicrobiales bacterium]